MRFWRSARSASLCPSPTGSALSSSGGALGGGPAAALPLEAHNKAQGLASSLMVTAEMLLLLRNCKDGIHWVESVNRVIEECRAASERRFRQTMKVEGRKNNCVGPTAMVEHSHTPTFPSKPRVHSTS